MRLRAAEHGMRSQPLLRFLHWLYRAEPVFSRAGQIYPIAVFPASLETTIDNLLAQPLDRAIPDDDLVQSAEFRELLARAGRRLNDLPTFTMRALAVAPDAIRLHCGMGSYFRMLDTCDALEFEALSQASQLTGNDEDAFGRFADLLPLRRELHRRVARPVRDGAHRSAALGISVLVAFRHGDGFGLILRRRSAQVATGAGLLHLVPTFMFQPMTADVAAEFSIRHNIFREYLEELFGLPDAGGTQKAIYSDPRLIFLHDLLTRGEAALQLTGIAVGLLNLRVEICTLLLIRSEAWHTRHLGAQRQPADALRFSDEVADPAGEAFIPIAFDGAMSDDELLHRAGVTADRTVPGGAGAFWLGIDRLRAVL
jgi:hypothetical protein